MIKSPLIVARTGDAENTPDNTLPAFESAIARGANGVELDVHASSDGELVVHHSHNLGMTDNGAGLLSEHSLTELKALDAGTWFGARFAGERMPTLGAVFDLSKGRIRFEVDLKGSSLGFLQRVIREVERFELIDAVELTTAHYPLLVHAKQINSHLRLGTFFYQPPDWLPIRPAQQQALDWAELLNLDAVHLHPSLITADYVQTLHEDGFEIHGSNLDSPAGVRYGLELGIDCLSTSRLGMALRVRDPFVTRRL